MAKKMSLMFIALFVLFASTAYAEELGYIIKMRDDFVMPISEDSELSPISAGNSVYYTQSEELAEEYLANGLAEHIERDFLVYAYDTLTSYDTLTAYEPESTYEPESSYYNIEQWSLDTINAESPWIIETYGNEIKVAVIDSGCYTEHYELLNNVLPGYDYINKTTAMTDDDGHGTHVSGIIAAEIDGFGIAGIAPKAKIVPLKILENGEGLVSDLIQAVYDAVDVFGCQVINMSIGSEEHSEEFEAAVNYATEKGVIVVAAAGNDGTKGSPVSYPAGYENVISVGAVMQDKNLAYFSTNNKTVWVCAPGYMIVSTFPGSQFSYSYLSGTSMSAPMVSAAAAIALSADSTITPQQFREIIASSAQPMGTSSENAYGNGILDIDAMLTEILESKSFYISPVNYGYNQNSIPIAYIAFLNNSDEARTATVACAVYDDEGRFLNTSFQSVDMEAKTYYCFGTANPNNNYKYFLLSDFEGLIPLATARDNFSE